MGGSGASEAFEKSHYGNFEEMLGIVEGTGQAHRMVDKPLE